MLMLTSLISAILFSLNLTGWHEAPPPVSNVPESSGPSTISAGPEAPASPMDCGSIQGRIMWHPDNDSTMAPLVGQQVWLFDLATGYILAGGVTNSQGNYVIDLPLGMSLIPGHDYAVFVPYDPTAACQPICAIYEFNGCFVWDINFTYHCPVPPTPAATPTVTATGPTPTTGGPTQNPN